MKAADPADDLGRQPHCTRWKNDHDTASFADTVSVRNSNCRSCIVPMAGRIAIDPGHDDGTGGGNDRDPDFFSHDENPPRAEVTV